jgi:hypothetical protein
LQSLSLDAELDVNQDSKRTQAKAKEGSARLEKRILSPAGCTKTAGNDNGCGNAQDVFEAGG